MKRNMAARIFGVVFLLTLSACDHEVPPDRTGSWGQISEPIVRGEDWQQIVTDSAFPLGERTLKEKRDSGDGVMEEIYAVSYGDYPRLDGSTVAVPLAVEFARQHLGLSDKYANGLARFSKTHEAYERLINSVRTNYSHLVSDNTYAEDMRPVDLLIATEPSEDELYLAEERGVTLVTRPVCYDAFVFITHKDNPVDSLTVEQIRGIYSGEITNWKDVGGEDREIIAYQRERNSGSQTAMGKLVMQRKKMISPPMVSYLPMYSMGELVEAVAEYQNDKTSIGYTFQYYINTLYKNENIKTLRIEDISPAPEHLQDQTYPLTTFYYGVIRGGEEDAVGGRFLDWMLSEEGQRCIAQAGYIPLA